MIKILLTLTISTITYLQCYTQQTATLLYNWQDTSLVGSWMYDNTYNECWGVYINEREIAIIGSTDGTHFFDVTDPQIVVKLLLYRELTQGVELYIEIIMITKDIFMLYVMKEAHQPFKLLILLTYQIL